MKAVQSRSELRRLGSVPGTIVEYVPKEKMRIRRVISKIVRREIEKAKAEGLI